MFTERSYFSFRSWLILLFVLLQHDRLVKLWFDNNQGENISDAIIFMASPGS